MEIEAASQPAGQWKSSGNRVSQPAGHLGQSGLEPSRDIWSSPSNTLKRSPALVKELPRIITGDTWNHLEPSGGQAAGWPMEVKWKSNGNRKGIESASQPASQPAGQRKSSQPASRPSSRPVARKSHGNRISQPAGKPVEIKRKSNGIRVSHTAGRPANWPATGNRQEIGTAASRPASWPASG